MNRAAKAVEQKAKILHRIRAKRGDVMGPEDADTLDKLDTQYALELEPLAMVLSGIMDEITAVYTAVDPIPEQE